MYSNIKKGRVSNVDEILNRASLQLKGVINTEASDSNLRKSKKSDWQSIDDISDISISNDSSIEAKPKKANKFLKKKNNESGDKPTTIRTIARIDNAATKNTKTFISELQSPETSTKRNLNEISLNSLESANTFIRKHTPSISNFENNLTEINEISNYSFNSNKDQKNEIRSTSKSIENVKNEESVEDVLPDVMMTYDSNDYSGDGGGKDEDVTGNDLNVMKDNDQEINTASSFDDDYNFRNSLATEEDDDIFGNIQADASDLIRAFESVPEKIKFEEIQNSNDAVYGNNDDADGYHHHDAKTKQKNKAQFDFNASSKEEVKADPFWAKTKNKPSEHSKSLFHANSGRTSRNRAKERRRASKGEDSLKEENEVVEGESITSFVEESLSEIHSRSSDETSNSSIFESDGVESSRSRRSEGSNRSMTSTLSGLYSNDSFESYSSKTERRFVSVEVQTGVDLGSNEGHWLLHANHRPHSDLRFKDTDRKFLTSKEGINSLLDLTSFAPAMSCLNSIIKQQVSLLANFVAIQKTFHRQMIESTNQKAPYKYATLKVSDILDKGEQTTPSQTVL